MAISVCEVSITQSPLELPRRSHDATAGAVVDFWGVVRRIENGREINGIDYEAHPVMAEHQMRKLAERAIGKFGLTKLAIRHRVGFVPAMEPSIVVHIESAHRGAAALAQPHAERRIIFGVAHTSADRAARKRRHAGTAR